MKQGKATTVQDRSGKCLTDERETLNRWTEYCTELYNHKANGNPSVLDCRQTDTEDDHPILHGEVEAAVQSLKKGKSAGVDNIPTEMVELQAGGEDVITTLMAICNKIWQTGEWPTPWTQSLVITLPKEGNLQQCQNYHTITLISHPSKVTLKIMLNRLKPQVEKIIVKEQAGFRAGRSTTEQIFNLRILCEKYLQHQQDLYHFFIDIKVFDRVLACRFVGNHEEVQHQHQPYPSHQKPLRQGHQCSPLQQQHRILVPNYSWSLTGMSTLTHPLQHILERITTDALEDHEGTVSIGGRTITNLRFADDIDGLAGEEEELANLVERLDRGRGLAGAGDISHRECVG